jgi:IclR family mhp operon transcriptional activator
MLGGVMTQDEAVRSVARALEILRALQAAGKATLVDLQARTALPKPTLLRLLRTLESENAVWRAKGDGLWRPVFEMVPTRILSPEHQKLIDMALPILETLRAKFVWPSDLAVREASHMMLLETTRRASGLAVNRDEIGHKIDMLRSAVGRAYFASCPPEEREELTRQLARAQGLSQRSSRANSRARKVFPKRWSRSRHAKSSAR